MHTPLHQTRDGSWTLQHACGETYHSRFGARRECEQVYLRNSGIAARLDAGLPCTVLEIGLGTGMNFLTCAQRHRGPGALHYYGVDPQRPPPPHTASVLTRNFDNAENWINFVAQASGTSRHAQGVFLHCVSKLEHLPFLSVDAIFLDAFSPRHAPQCWDGPACAHYARLLKPGAVLASYCVQGTFQRALALAGLQVRRLRGPRGKREVLRAIAPL